LPRKTREVRDSREFAKWGEGPLALEVFQKTTVCRYAGRIEPTRGANTPDAEVFLQTNIHRLESRGDLSRISARIKRLPFRHLARGKRKFQMRFIDREEVARRLTYDVCIPIVREAMIAFSRGETRQLLRSIIPLSGGRMFGVMPGAMGTHAPFGAKLISVFPENSASGKQSHQGLVILFEPETGVPVCIVHAGEITAIRTAAASAVATDALARKDARRLAILGTGEQAATHARAIRKVRDLESIVIWGRSPERARTFAQRMQSELGVPVIAATTVEEAVAAADIVCTVTSAAEPILKGAWVRSGTHLNLVGSSHAGPSEVDSDLVVRSRFIADSREGVINQGAEFLRAKAAGLVGDNHVVAEIGQVLAGKIEGRRSPQEITVYKSLGHIVQDLASAWMLYSQADNLATAERTATTYLR
jgi:ornithine cyclodeaminase/alanine dehydrogenase-like protein (mu-crystallin family)